MKNKTLMRMVLAVAVLGVAMVSVEAKDQLKGTLNVTVLDENGALVANAPVFIMGDKKTRFVGGKEIKGGTETLDMPAGTYRISAAIIRQVNGYTDRFASPEAFVEVVAGDNSVVTLHLKAVENPMARMGYTELSKVGLDPETVHSF